MRLNEIAGGDLRILNPLTEADLHRLGELAGAAPGARVVDLACGTGEMLARWAGWFGTAGTGVDISEVFVARGRARATELGVADAVNLVVGDAAAYRAGLAVFDIAVCLGAAWIGNGLEGTAALLRPALRPGGVMVLGDEHWTEPPPAEAIAAIAGPPPDTTLAGNTAILERAGRPRSRRTSLPADVARGRRPFRPRTIAPRRCCGTWSAIPAPNMGARRYLAGTGRRPAEAGRGAGRAWRKARAGPDPQPAG